VQTTSDGRISLDTARCIGTCGLAPLVVCDGVVCGNPTPQSVQRQLEEWGEHGSPE
jgi:bidirectional [NiFe] hydrogenase diaphorase subunit